MVLLSDGANGSIEVDEIVGIEVEGSGARVESRFEEDVEGWIGMSVEGSGAADRTFHV